MDSGNHNVVVWLLGQEYTEAGGLLQLPSYFRYLYIMVFNHVFVSHLGQFAFGIITYWPTNTFILR
jgi:hypothetical protein